MSERKHILLSAAFWFNAARKHQEAGSMGEALLCMENAYNHVENALAATAQIPKKVIFQISRAEEKMCVTVIDDPKLHIRLDLSLNDFADTLTGGRRLEIAPARWILKNL